MARDERVSAKVVRDVKKELEVISGGYGLTLSALVAYILGQWLFNYRSQAQSGVLPSVAPPGVPAMAVEHGQGVPE